MERFDGGVGFGGLGKKVLKMGFSGMLVMGRVSLSGRTIG